MKKLILIAFAACMLVTNPSQAGFIMKKHATTAAVENLNAGSEAAPLVTSESSTVVTQSKEVVKKQSLLKRIFNKAKEAEVSQLLYIVMSFFWLGWLAMGINDNFEGNDWVISLVLYVLGVIPGIIYTLIKMKKYY